MISQHDSCLVPLNCRTELLVVADFGTIYRKSVINQHKLASLFQKIDKPLCRKIIGAAGVKPFLRAEFLGDCLQQPFFRV